MDDSLNVKRRLSCMLAADAVGYSAHMAQDEVCTGRVLSAHRAIIDSIVAFHEGRIVNTAGDSVLAEFASAVEAVRCAAEIQDALKIRNESLAPEHRLSFRIGINLGDVMVSGKDLLGDGVNIAARLEGIAEPGGICISSSVFDQITGKLDLGFEDIGQQSLKNIGRPIHVYRVSGVRHATEVARAPGRATSSRKLWPAIAATAGVLLVSGIVWRMGLADPAGAGSAAPAKASAASTTSSAAEQGVEENKVPSPSAASGAAATAPAAKNSSASGQAGAPQPSHTGTANRAIAERDEAFELRARSNAEIAQQRARSIINRASPPNGTLTPRATPHVAPGIDSASSDLVLGGGRMHSRDVRSARPDGAPAQRGAPFNPTGTRH